MPSGLDLALRRLVDLSREEIELALAFRQLSTEKSLLTPGHCLPLMPEVWVEAEGKQSRQKLASG